MILHDEIIHQYVNDLPLDAFVYGIYPNGQDNKNPDVKRKDVVIELHYLLLPILQKHVFFNMELATYLDASYEVFLQHVHIHLLVNAPKPYDLYAFYDKQQQFHLYVDLIQIADHTSIVSQMMFLLQNQISEQCIRAFIKTKFLLMSEDYLSILNYQTFVNGFSSLLSWNQDIDQYTFQRPEYDVRKEQAFGMLYEAMQLTDQNKQQTIFSFLKNASLWEQFTKVAGLFFLYDVYCEQGAIGLKTIYEKGYHKFIQNIFQ